MFKIGEISALSGLSIRALHHFDEIGLLKPAHRDPSGYRRYDRANVERLQNILLLREMGMSLQEISNALKNEPLPGVETLKKHRGNLLNRKESLENLIQNLTRTIEIMEKNQLVTESDLFKGFSPEKIKALNDEVDAKYDPEIVAESRKRTASFTKNQWDDIQQKGKDVELKLAELMHLLPNEETVQQQVALHHQWIEHFYPCNAVMYRGLASLYLEDERFKAHYEHVKPGLAHFLSRAMLVFAERSLE